jgi:hypothetical protein
LKVIFKGAATTIVTKLEREPLRKDYERMLTQGTKPNLAKLTLARKIAALSAVSTAAGALGMVGG